MEGLQKRVLELDTFKRNMGLVLDEDMARYIWGKREVKVLIGKGFEFKRGEQNVFLESKLEKVRENIDALKVLNWVKFIGVSGSVAAGFAKEDDDIDLFIVVRNGCVWLYRGILTLRGLFNGLFRAKRYGEDVKDRFCINLIVEEKGLKFDNDIFNFHELMYLVPIYEPEYLNYIYSRNTWLREDFRVKKELLISKVREEKRVNLLIRILNYGAFCSQFIFMFLTGHSPNLKRLKKNYKNGRIEFFEEDYKEKYL
jgi:predicted nucleotidyltransferase